MADHLRRGGPTFAYRVEATPIVRQLSFLINENESIALSVPKNNRAFALFTASRTGFDGDLDVRFDGLPEGVTVEHAPLLKGQTKLPVIISATADAATNGALVDLAATFEDLTGRLQQSVTLVEGNNRIVFFDRDIDRLAMAVTNTSPFSLQIKEALAPVVRGANKRLTIVATRAEGFTGDIKLRVPYLPKNFGSGTATIAGDRTEIGLLLEANLGAKVGPLPVVVLGESAGYSVCSSFTPVEVTERWVVFTVPPVDIEQGQETEVTVTLAHSRAYDGTFKATMLQLPKGVTSEPLEFTHDTAELRFPLRVAADAPPGKRGAMAIHCVLESAGEPIPHFSAGAQLQVFKPLPAELQQAPPPPKPAEEKKKEAPKRRTRFPVTSS